MLDSSFHEQLVNELRVDKNEDSNSFIVSKVGGEGTNTYADVESSYSLISHHPERPNELFLQ